jgi:hypothetical protein
MLTIINHPVFLVFASVVLTLIGKGAWNRWLSKSSRITEQKCKDNQALCFLSVVAKITEVNTKITKISDDLSCGDANFEHVRLYEERTTRTLKLILLTLSELCLVGEGCEERTRKRIDEELLR